MLVVARGFETVPWSLARCWVLLKTKERRIKTKDERTRFPVTRLIANVLSRDADAREGKRLCREPGWRAFSTAATLSLRTIDTLAGSSPELPAKPFLSREPAHVRNGRAIQDQQPSFLVAVVWKSGRGEGKVIEKSLLPEIRSGLQPRLPAGF